MLHRVSPLLKACALTLLAASCLSGTELLAQPFRCVATDAKVTYTDQPCPGAKQQQLSIVDNSSDSSEVRQSIAAGALKRSRAGVEPASSGGAAGSLGADPDAVGTCPAKRRDYEIAVSQIKRELSSMERQYVAATRACGRSFERSAEHLRYAEEDRARRRAAQHLNRAPLRGGKSEPVPGSNSVIVPSDQL